MSLERKGRIFVCYYEHFIIFIRHRTTWKKTLQFSHFWIKDKNENLQLFGTFSKITQRHFTQTASVNVQ